MEATEIIQAIARGDVDDALDAIFNATRQRERYRRSMVAAENQATLTPGTEVEVIDIRPKRLIGSRGVVSPHRARGDNLMVEFTPPLPGYGNPLSVPAQCLRAVA